MLPFVVCDHCDVVATTAVFFVRNIVPLPRPSTKSREVLLALLSSILSQHSTTAQNHTLCEIVQLILLAPNFMIPKVECIKNEVVNQKKTDQRRSCEAIDNSKTQQRRCCVDLRKGISPHQPFRQPQLQKTGGEQSFQSQKPSRFSETGHLAQNIRLHR